MTNRFTRPLGRTIDYTFKSVPTHDELREMDRDLCFYPCTFHDPTTLTTKQTAAFNRSTYRKRRASWHGSHCRPRPGRYGSQAQLPTALRLLQLGQGQKDAGRVRRDHQLKEKGFLMDVKCD